MKRLITALGFSLVALSASAVELSAPFEQLKLDRALPNIDVRPVESYSADSRAPFEQNTLDRALPNLPSRNVQFAESAAGATRTDASASAQAPKESPFANDHQFIAPPQ
jgi:hypothetical protein